MSNPFKGRAISAPPPMRVLHRFSKLGGRLAEIRERKVTNFNAFEWLQFIDGSLIELRMYHGDRVPLYGTELRAQVAPLQADGWQELPNTRATDAT